MSDDRAAKHFQGQNVLLKVGGPALYYLEQQIYHPRLKIGNRDSEGESFCIEYIVDIGFRIFL